MSDDLVKRLRQGGTYQHDTVPMQKAADRIEKLEAALRAVLRKCSWYDAAIYDDFNKVIQKALEGKDD